MRNDTAPFCYDVCKNRSCKRLGDCPMVQVEGIHQASHMSSHVLRHPDQKKGGWLLRFLSFFFFPCSIEGNFWGEKGREKKNEQYLCPSWLWLKRGGKEQEISELEKKTNNIQVRKKRTISDLSLSWKKKSDKSCFFFSPDGSKKVNKRWRCCMPCRIRFEILILKLFDLKYHFT